MNLVHPSHDILWSKSNAVRGNIITALAEQYQRIQQRKPMPHSLPPPTPKTPQYSVAAIFPGQNEPKGPNCQGIIKYYNSQFSCELCHWALGPGISVQLNYGYRGNWTKDNKAMDLLDFIRKFHNYSACWRCDLCIHAPEFKTHAEMLNHCSYFHTLADITDGVGQIPSPPLPTPEAETKPHDGLEVEVAEVGKGGKFQALRLGVRRMMFI